MLNLFLRRELDDKFRSDTVVNLGKPGISDCTQGAGNRSGIGQTNRHGSHFEKAEWMPSRLRSGRRLDLRPAQYEDLGLR
jgi:hypothetical protein